MLTGWSSAHPNGATPAWLELEYLRIEALARIDGMSADVEHRLDILSKLDFGRDENFSIRAHIKKLLAIAERVESAK